MTKRVAPEHRKKRGRPPGDSYTQDIADEICTRLGAGEPLAVMCRDEHLPGVTTVWTWSNARPDFAVAIARARVEGHDAIAAECLVIADTPVEGVETTTKPDGAIETKSGDMLGHRKLQIETRLKLLAKWDPKRYGDKQQLEHSASESLADLIAKSFERKD